MRCANPARHAPRDDGRLVELGLLVEQSAFDAGQGAGDYQRIGRAVTRILESIDMMNSRNWKSTASGSGGTVSLTCAAAISTGVAPVNGRCPAIPLVGDDAQRVDVGLWRRLLALRLLGRDVLPRCPPPCRPE